MGTLSGSMGKAGNRSAGNGGSGDSGDSRDNGASGAGSGARKAIALLFMDGPYESANSTTAVRIIDAALRRGMDVHVTAYEGAVAYSVAAVRRSSNPTHAPGDSARQRRATSKDFVRALMRAAADRGVKLDWLRIGECEDERGVYGDQLEGTRRGTPADFVDQIGRSGNVLVIPTR